VHKDRIVSAIDEAQRLSAEVASEFRVAAFTTLLQFLLQNEAETPSPKAHKRDTSAVRQGKPKNNSGSSAVDDLIAGIDLSEHEAIHEMTTAKDLALYVLLVAQRAGVEGLRPAEIHQVLKQKFRINKELPAIQMALKEAKTLIDRNPDGSAFKYSIMRKGEEYLNGKMANTQKTNH
jgi:hypothetical protein